MMLKMGWLLVKKRRMNKLSIKFKKLRYKMLKRQCNNKKETTKYNSYVPYRKRK